ncbi:MAG: HAD-IC family P-type ATPase [Patescibacteria group bacterium]
MPSQIEKKWHSLSMAKVFALLKSAKAGLSGAEAKNRQKIYGLNRLPKEKPFSRLKLLISQIKSPLVYILFFAAIISLLLDHLTDFSVIFFVVVVNTIFGFWQESKANKSLEKLKEIIKYKAKVLRDGYEVMIEADELVPGDVILVSAGDRIPADARIFIADNLQITEAALTGESNPSKKGVRVLSDNVPLADRENMVYLGTLASRGSGWAVVCATGGRTEVGKIAGLIREVREEKTPLQRKLAQFSNWLTLVIVFLCLLIFIIGFLAGKDPIEMLMFTVALAVAAIPEGLLVAVTIILTVGMQFILKRQALVRKLIATETLGSVSIICADKTGTITTGEMQVSKIITADKEYAIPQSGEYLKKEKVQDLILKISVLCSSAQIENPNAELEALRIIGDPTEKALVLAAVQSGFNKEKLDNDYTKQSAIPFDSQKKFMATIHNHASENHQHVFVKGAPEIVFKFCHQVLVEGMAKPLDVKMQEYLKTKHENLTKKGLRLLGFAYKTGQFKNIEAELNGLVFLGFVALKDPLREGIKETFQLCHRAGIRPVIITGDHKLTAKAIFEELKLPVDGNIIEGSELDKWDDEELKKQVKHIDVYARVEPIHKLRIVKAWQACDEVVAMTGDGINDAPAIKSADIGIALGSGSDVTKETADLVLLDNNFKVIVAAIEQGRIIFDNIRKVILYLLSNSFAEMILIASSIVLGLPMPILVTQILWINLITDGLPNLAIALEPGERGVMADRPRRRNEPLLSQQMKILIFVIGLIVNFMLLGVFVYLLRISNNLDYIRTIIFAALGMNTLFYVFSIRSVRHSIFAQNPLSNKYLNFAVLTSVVILLAAIYVPFLQEVFQTVYLGWTEWMFVVAISIIQIMLIELVKYYFIIKRNKSLSHAQ